MIEQPTIPDDELAEACRMHASKSWALLNMQAAVIETANMAGVKMDREEAAVAMALLLQTVAFNRLADLIEAGHGSDTDPGVHSYTSRLITRAVDGTFTERSGTERPKAAPPANPSPPGDPEFGDDL